MKISNKKIMCLLCTVLAVVTLSSTVGYALSSTTKSIDVYTGVNIYIDDQKLYPTDANGNPVEPFIYNGTTYLPVRALSQALGKVVQWDGKTSSVYVGKHESDKPAVWLTNMEWYTRGSGGFERYTSEKDSLGYTHYNILKTDPHWNYENFRIDGQYTAISGVLFQPYTYRENDSETTLNIYGDGELLYTATVRGGKNPIDPISFKVDITGVLELKVELAQEMFSLGSEGYGLLGDCGLWS